MAMGQRTRHIASLPPSFLDWAKALPIAPCPMLTEIGWLMTGAQARLLISWTMWRGQQSAGLEGSIAPAGDALLDQ